MSDQAQEQSLEQQMIDVLVREEAQESEEPLETQDVEPTNETEEESEEPSQEESEAEKEQRKFTLKRESGDVEVTEDEIVELAMKGYDYTQKTQATAEERRANEAQAQVLKELEAKITTQFEQQQALIKEYGVLENLNEKIGQYSQIDWNNAYDTDPVQAAKAFAQYQQLMVSRQDVLGTINTKQSEMQSRAEQEIRKSLMEAEKELLKAIPDWNDEKKAKIRETGKAYGFEDNELATIKDPRVIRVLHDAMKYRALESSKSDVKQKVNTKPPVVKPSGKSQTAERNKSADLRDKLRKTGDPTLAAKLIENML